MKCETQKLEKNFISVVVYIHDTEDYLADFLECITEFLKSNFQRYECIFVNDASTDGSIQLIRDYYHDNKKGAVSILNMSYYQGIEVSMSAGMDLAVGDFIYEFDTAVLSYPAQLLRDVYDKCLEGNDIVSACPQNQRHRYLRSFYKVYNKYSNSQNSIQTETFRILSRRAVNRVYSMSQTLLYRQAVYADCGLPACPVFYEVSGGFPVLKKKERYMQEKAAMDALMLYTNAAYRFALGFSCIMIIFSLLVCIYIAAVFIAGKPVPGYVSTIATIAFGFFGVNVFMSILIKYASLILKVVFTRKKYITESIEKL